MTWIRIRIRIRIKIKWILSTAFYYFLFFRLLPDRVTQQHKLTREEWEERITNW